MRTLRLRYFATHTKICIIGGGSAGLNISAHLAKLYDPKTIRIFEPYKLHYYQPGFTMVGGDLVDGKEVMTDNDKLFKKDVNWTQEKVKKVEPNKNLIVTQSGEEYTYDQLIVASGVKLDWYKIQGAKEALNDPDSPVVSIYTYDTAEKTRQYGRSFTGGTAVFTEPQQPIKCGGAPQKILYLWTKKWHDKKLKFESHFYKVGETMFPVPKYSAQLSKIAEQHGIIRHFKMKLVEVKKDTREAVFVNLSNNENETIKFDFLHLVPPMSPHPYIEESGIGNSAGYVDVDKETLQHVKYQNIWSLGDCSSLPCSKTAAAVFSQSEILIKNLNSAMKKEALTSKYNGYSCCPIFVGGNKLMLAEFLYEHQPTRFAQMANLQVPTRRFYLMKRYFFPFAYWRIVPTGFWAGRKGIATDW